MGNIESSSGRGSQRSPRKSRRGDARNVADRAKRVVGESVQNLQASLQSQIKQLEEQDHPAAHFLDSVCGAYMDDSRDRRDRRSDSFYSEDYGSEDEDDQTYSEDETTTTTDYNGSRRGRSRRRDDPSTGGDTSSYFESDHEREDRRSQKKKSGGSGSFESEDEYSKGGKSDAASQITEDAPKSAPGPGIAPGSSSMQPKPLASSFAKRCYFTKSGIGSSTQHYEGLTLNGNAVLMLAAAMKLKDCPTICDEDLRRVEQIYPNQFSRLPDELLLSSGWRRVAKYCHFSNKPIPDGVPFFHSKQRSHPSGGHYFLLAAAVGMVRPMDVEPLTRDTLVLLETDFPNPCDAAPSELIEDPDQWTLVDKFCFFSGGPINPDEDVYYEADFEGNPIFMLAFLSPSLTPNELYKIDAADEEPVLKSVVQVQEVETVYDLTERDFDDLRLYHLGPCRALPQYILQPSAWTKILPPHFLSARETALQRAEDYEMATHGGIGMHQQISPLNMQQHARSVGAVRQIPESSSFTPSQHIETQIQQPIMSQSVSPLNHNQHLQNEQIPESHRVQHMGLQVDQIGMPIQTHMPMQHEDDVQMQHMQHHQYYPQEEGMIPMDEAGLSRRVTHPFIRAGPRDPPEDDEPPSLSNRLAMEQERIYLENQAPIHDLRSQHQHQHHQHIHGYASYSPEPHMQSYPHHDEMHHDHVHSYQSHEQPSIGPSYHNEGHAQMDSEYQNYYTPEINGYQDPEEHVHGYEGPPTPNYSQEKNYPNTDSQTIDYHDQETNFHSEHASPYFGEQSAPIHDQYYTVDEAANLGVQNFPEPTSNYSDEHDDHLSPNQDSEQDFHRDKNGSEPFSPQESPSTLKYEYSADPTEVTESPNEFGRMSPSSEANGKSEYSGHSKSEYSGHSKSEYSVQSQAMKGARELLKRNRQKRLEMIAKQNNGEPLETKEEESTQQDLVSPRSEASGATWESGSEVSGSAISATSSGWTETSAAPERSSRRALILQMAKARMKTNKSSGSTAGDTPRSQIVGTYSITEEEKKLDGPLDDQATEFDMAGDLD